MTSGVLAGRATANVGLVVVGTGVAGLRVAQSVRQEGYEGPVMLVGAEPHLPYDRPPLSKQVLQGELSVDATEYHAASYYTDDLGAEVIAGRSAASVDIERSRLTLDDGVELPFSALVIATGSRPRRLPFGTPTVGLHVLRTRDDALALREALHRSTRLAVVGAGFIGAEVASTAKSMGLDVTVIETAATPLARVVGPELGRELAALHERSGVTLICGKAVTGFIGRERVEGLILDDGSALEVDLVVLGVGVVPDVEWLQESGLALADGLACDAFLNAGRPNIFGAGDAVSWPNSTFGRRVRSQQWTTAADQGRHVGRVLVRGETTGPFTHDMYFWSDQYGSRIQGVGVQTRDAQVLRRHPGAGVLVAAYRDAGLVRGVLTVNAPRDFNRLRKLAVRLAPWEDVEEPPTPATSQLTGGAA
jgi:3-phenylpropionate/trans-cinnamate dioxygenase ferredoxin reductase subunit